jgi:hypothetical protein
MTRDEPLQLIQNHNFAPEFDRVKERSKQDGQGLLFLGKKYDHNYIECDDEDLNAQDHAHDFSLVQGMITTREETCDVKDVET